MTFIVIMTGRQLGPLAPPPSPAHGWHQGLAGEEMTQVDEWLVASGKDGLPSHCPTVSLALPSTVATYGSETHSATYNGVSHA